MGRWAEFKTLEVQYVSTSPQALSHICGFNRPRTRERCSINLLTEFNRSQDPTTLTAEYTKDFTVNVLGNIHLFNVYLPLLRPAPLSGEKHESKVIVLSTGMADADMTAKYKVHEAAPYSIAKAALNMAVAKFHAGYADEGVLFMAICPGMVLNDSHTAQREFSSHQTRYDQDVHELLICTIFKPTSLKCAF